jgi:hypothetical protein
MEKTRKAEPIAHKIHEEVDEDEKYIQPRSNQPYTAVVDLLTNVFLAFIPSTISIFFVVVSSVPAPPITKSLYVVLE